MSGVLVACVGNIFNGDDAFGVEVARRLAERALPDGVKVVDFGIRGLDLAYALLDGYRAAVLVDTVQRGGAPGTVSVIEPEPPGAAEDVPAFTPHALDPATVLRFVHALGAACPRLLVVGCEPLTFGGEEGVMELSAPVAAAVGPAADTVENLARGLLEKTRAPYAATGEERRTS